MEGRLVADDTELARALAELATDPGLRRTMARHNARVAFRAAEAGEREALRMASMDDGATFATICETIAGTAGESGDVAALINRLLGRWLADGLLIQAVD